MILSEEKRILIEAYKDGLRSVLMENPNMLAQMLIDQIKRIVTKSVLQPKLPKIMEELKKYSVDQLKGAINYFCSPTDAECIRMVEPFTKRQHMKILGEGGIAAAVGEAYQEFFEPIFRKKFPAGGTSSAKGTDNALASIKPKVSGVVTKAFGKHLISVQKQKRAEAEQKMRERRYKVNQKFSYRKFKDLWQEIKRIVKKYKNTEDEDEKDKYRDEAINKAISIIEEYYQLRKGTDDKPKKKVEVTTDMDNLVYNKDGFIMLPPGGVFYPYFIEMWLRGQLDPDDSFKYARGLTARAKGVDIEDNHTMNDIATAFREIKDRLAPSSSTGDPKIFQHLTDPYTAANSKYPEIFEMITHDGKMNWEENLGDIYDAYRSYLNYANEKYDYSNERQRKAIARANS